MRGLQQTKAYTASILSSTSARVIRQCSMDSTAVLFFSVFSTWILFEASVFGQDCKNVQPANYIFVGYPLPINYQTPWYNPPPKGGTRRNLAKSEESNEDESPAFRDFLSNIKSPTKTQKPEEPTERSFFETLFGNYDHGDENMYPYGNDYRRNNFWSRFNDYFPQVVEYPASMFDGDWNSPQKFPRNDQLGFGMPWRNDVKKKTRKVNKVDNHPNWRFVDREVCGESLDDRIIGGTEAALGQYPWLALLGFKNGTVPGGTTTFSCGGALITPCWVASAAHCITGLPSGYYVSVIRLGEHNLNTKVDCDSDVCAEPVQDFVPVQLIAHKDFNSPKLKNDISLIKLNRPAMISKWVQPICLPYGNILSQTLLHKIGEVAGWGVENIETHQTSKILQTIKLPVRPLENCREVYKKKAHIDDNQFCVGGAIGFDSCNGDSGGPFMKVDVANGSTPKYFLYGIVSFGAAKCGKKPTPGVYTRVAKYMSWVLDHLTDC